VEITPICSTKARARCWVLRLLMAAVLLTASATRAAEIHDAIPERFRGTWASSWMHCTFGGESKLAIGEHTVDFYESRGRVLAIATQGEAELGVLIEASGEGQTWLSALQFRLSEDQQTLSVFTGDRRIDRTRCETKNDRVEPVPPA
jgi:hypothetical protein